MLFGSGYVQKWNNIYDGAKNDDNLNAVERQAILTDDVVLKNIPSEKCEHTTNS